MTFLTSKCRTTSKRYPGGGNNPATGQFAANRGEHGKAPGGCWGNARLANIRGYAAAVVIVDEFPLSRP